MYSLLCLQLNPLYRTRFWLKGSKTLCNSRIHFNCVRKLSSRITCWFCQIELKLQFSSWPVLVCCDCERGCIVSKQGNIGEDFWNWAFKFKYLSVYLRRDGVFWLSPSMEFFWLFWACSFGFSERVLLAFPSPECFRFFQLWSAFRITERGVLSAFPERGVLSAFPSVECFRLFRVWSAFGFSERGVLLGFPSAWIPSWTELNWGCTFGYSPNHDVGGSMWDRFFFLSPGMATLDRYKNVSMYTTVAPTFNNGVAPTYNGVTE